MFHFDEPGHYFMPEGLIFLGQASMEIRNVMHNKKEYYMKEKHVIISDTIENALLKVLIILKNRNAIYTYL